MKRKKRRPVGTPKPLKRHKRPKLTPRQRGCLPDLLPPPAKGEPRDEEE